MRTGTIECPDCLGRGVQQVTYGRGKFNVACQRCHAAGRIPAAPPRRIQLRRTAGFCLQVTSRAANGRPAIKVDRSTRWGNPYPVSPEQTAAQVVEAFRACLLQWTPQQREEYLAPLRDRNLACWCPHPQPGQPDICHASVLLELANA